MFQEHLSCPSGECAWCHPDLAGSVKADYCGKHEESYWYFQTEACLTGGGEDGWKTNQNEEEGTGNAEVSTPKVLILLKSLTPVFWAIHPVQLVSVCVLTGCVQPWSWAYPACLGACAFGSLS